MEETAGPGVGKVPFHDMAYILQIQKSNLKMTVKEKKHDRPYNDGGKTSPYV